MTQDATRKLLWFRPAGRWQLGRARDLLGGLLSVVVVLLAIHHARRATSQNRPTDTTQVAPERPVRSFAPPVAPAPRGEAVTRGPEATPGPLAQTTDSFVLQATGDVILHERVNQSAARFAETDIEGGAGYTSLFDGIRSVLAHGDVNFVNLETPLATQRNAASMNPPILNGPPDVARALGLVGFHVVQLANNHAYDQGILGVLETKAHVRAAGLIAVGSGAGDEAAREAQFVDVRGAKIAVLAFTSVLNGGPRGSSLDQPRVAVFEESRDLELLRASRARADALVVMIHWGAELENVPSGVQVRSARAMCRAGADVIFGEHSHVVQRVDVLDIPLEEDPSRTRKCVVAYSLGNLVSNQGLKYLPGRENPEPGSAEFDGRTRDGLLVRVEMARSAEGRWQPNGVSGVPLFTLNNWEDRYGEGDAFVHVIRTVPLARVGTELGNRRGQRIMEERRSYLEQVVGRRVPLLDE